MTTAHAVRKAGNLYDFFEGGSMDREVSWQYIERFARREGITEITVDQSRYQPEGEDAKFTVTVTP